MGVASLTSDDFLILMNAKTSAIRISDLEREHGAEFICSADFCLAQAGESFNSDVECEVNIQIPCDFSRLIEMTSLRLSPATGRTSWLMCLERPE